MIQDPVNFEAYQAEWVLFLFLNTSLSPFILLRLVECTVQDEHHAGHDSLSTGRPEVGRQWQALVEMWSSRTQAIYESQCV